MLRRDLLSIPLSAAAFWPFRPSMSQESTRLVKLLVGFPPGGPVDGIARVLLQPLGEAWNAPVIVDNHSGASGRIAVSLAAKAPPTGRTLLLTPGAQLTIQPHLYAGLDPLRQLAPLALIATTELSILVAPDHPAHDLAELKDWYARNPGLANCGTPGSGSVAHLAALEMARQFGVSLTPVHYRGAAEMLTALMGGNLQSALAVPWIAFPLVKAGKLRCLATTGAQRTVVMPAIPTARESGLDLVVGEWAGAFAPAGMSAEELDRLSQGFQTALARQSVRGAFQEYGLNPGTGGREEFAELVAQDYERWGQLVKLAGIKAET